MIDEQVYADARARWRRGWYDAGYFTADPVAVVLAKAVDRQPRTLFHYYRCGDPSRPVTSASVTAAELWSEARHVAAGLWGLGIGHGDVVAVQLPSWRETTVIYLAIWQLGAILVPVVHTYGAAEVAFILRESGAGTLVVPGAWRGVDYPGRVSSLSAPALERVIVVDEDAPAGMLRWKDLQRGANGDFPLPRPSPDDACLILYTSGTTSAPKGVLISHNNLRAEWSCPFFQTGGPYLCNFPAGHIAGLNFALRPLLTGTPMVYCDHWDPDLAASLIERHGIVESGGNGFFLRGLIEGAARGGIDLSGIKAFGMGGTGVSASEVRLAGVHGIAAGRVYGSTEHSTVTYTDPAWPLSKRAETDGRPLRGNQVRIVDEDGRELEPGDIGEIVTQGPELFIGYTDPLLNLESFSPDGWFRTGDLGRLDAEGFLTITDRKKDIIIRGGENISAKEVEDILNAHDAVEEVAAIGVADGRYGEKVGAVVRLRAGMHLDLDLVRQHFAAAGLARLKTPEYLFQVDDFPRTPAGKIKKHLLRERFRDGDPRGNEAPGAGGSSRSSSGRRRSEREEK